MSSTPRRVPKIVHLKAAFVVGAVLISTPAWSQVRTVPNDLLESARQSSLFEANVPASQLKARGLARIKMGEAMYLDLDRYVQETRLTAQPDLEALLQPAMQQGFLKARPVYEETILKLQDRIVIERELTVPISTGACARSDAPEAIARLCFRQKTGSIPDAIAADLDDIRGRLAAAPATREVKAGVTAGEALQMDDTALLGLLINSDARTIRRTSVIPLRTYNGVSKAGKVDMTNFSARLPRQESVSPVRRLKQPLVAIPMERATTPLKPAATSLKRTGVTRKRVGAPVARVAAPRKAVVRDHRTAVVRDHRTAAPDLLGAVEDATPMQSGDRYFLTGFTIGREYSDDIEYTFADSTWLTDRYYIHLSYSLSLGFGLRIPFSFSTLIAPVIGETDDRRTVEVSVDPVNVDGLGLPAYPEVELDESQYFDGDEFVMELIADAELYISIPGPNIDEDIPGVSFDESTNFDPVIGGESSHIGDIVLVPSSLSGLQIDASAGGAGIDLGLSAELSDGEIGMDASGWENTHILDGGERRYEFRNRNAQTFTMKPVDPGEKFGFVFSNPTYTASVGIAPFIQPWLYVDVGVWDTRWEMDPLTIDALAVSLGFNLDAHEGTRNDYAFSVQPISRCVGRICPTDAPVSPGFKAIKVDGGN